jgi:hypothetical protein
MDKLLGDETRAAWGQSRFSLPLQQASTNAAHPRARRFRRSRLDLVNEAELGPKETLGTENGDKEDGEAMISIGVDLGTT